MFDKLKSLGQLTQMMTKASKLQEQVKQMQEQLATRRISGEAGGGRVVAWVNGRMELVELRIDRERTDTSNVQLLQEMIVTAVQTAQYQAGEMVKQEMARITTELGVPADMLPQ